MSKIPSAYKTQARRLGLRVTPVGSSLMVYRDNRVLGSIQADSHAKDITEALRALESERRQTVNQRFQAVLDKVRSRSFDDWRVARGGRPRKTGRIRGLFTNLFLI